MESWILEVNLRPFFDAVASAADYGFDDTDWIAVDHALAATEHERGRWFDYPIGALSVSFARDPGSSDLVLVRVVGEEVTVRALDPAIRLLQLYVLRPD